MRIRATAVTASVISPAAAARSGFGEGHADGDDRFDVFGIGRNGAHVAREKEDDAFLHDRGNFVGDAEIVPARRLEAQFFTQLAGRGGLRRFIRLGAAFDDLHHRAIDRVARLTR